MAQSRRFPALAIYRGDEALAVAFFDPKSCKRLEFALALSPSATQHLTGLVRLAHSTLARMAESHCVFSVVHPSNPAGQRMARLTGFRPSRAGPQFWIFGRCA